MQRIAAASWRLWPGKGRRQDRKGRGRDWQRGSASHGVRRKDDWTLKIALQSLGLPEGHPDLLDTATKTAGFYRALDVDLGARWGREDHPAQSRLLRRVRAQADVHRTRPARRTQSTRRPFSDAAETPCKAGCARERRNATVRRAGRASPASPENQESRRRKAGALDEQKTGRLRNFARRASRCWTCACSPGRGRKAQFCTERLKRDVAVMFQLDLVDAGYRVISWQGIRRDRIARTPKRQVAWRIGPRMWTFRPLVERSAMDCSRSSLTGRATERSLLHEHDARRLHAVHQRIEGRG